MSDDSTFTGARRLLRPLNRHPSDGADGALADPKIAAVALLALLLIPLIPFLVVVWFVGRTLRGVRRRVSWE